MIQVLMDVSQQIYVTKDTLMLLFRALKQTQQNVLKQI